MSVAPTSLRADNHARMRRIKSGIMLGLCALAAGFGILLLGLVLYFLASQGLPYLNWTLISKLPDAVDASKGGVINSILGTLSLLGLASLFALPLGILGGIYQLEARGRFASLVRFFTDVLNGIPSIVIGIFVYAVIVYPAAQRSGEEGGKGFSVIAGSFALGIMMIPLVMRTTEEMLRLVPASMREASLGLGATRWRTMTSIILPAARGGIITGVMLALARAAGETAPLLFTVLGNEFFATRPVTIAGKTLSVPSLNEPVDALPLRIYKYATGPDEAQNHQAWAAALLLILLILVFSVAARFATRGNVSEEK